MEGIAMLRILLVDDEPLELQALRDHVDWNGLGIGHVDTARNGKAAYDSILEQEPDIVITDVHMPVMDGISALQVIHEQYPEIKVILLSGHADMQLAVHAMQCGAFGYLMKPVELEELLYKIEDAQTQARLENQA